MWLTTAEVVVFTLHVGVCLFKLLFRKQRIKITLVHHVQIRKPCEFQSNFLHRSRLYYSGQRKFEFQLTLRISGTQILLVQGPCVFSKFMIYLEDALPGALSIAGISMHGKLLGNLLFSDNLRHRRT